MKQTVTHQFDQQYRIINLNWASTIALANRKRLNRSAHRIMVRRAKKFKLLKNNPYTHLKFPRKPKILRGPNNYKLGTWRKVSILIKAKACSMMDKVWIFPKKTCKRETQTFLKVPSQKMVKVTVQLTISNRPTAIAKKYL